VEGNRKLAVILAADAVGYSLLMGDDEAATVRTLTEYRQLFTEHSAHHGGRIVDTAGDSVLAVFDSAVEAVECAAEIGRLCVSGSLPT
jgi:adenylate cyclase